MFTFHFSLPATNLSAEGETRLSSTSGEIYIETDDGYFPCLGWSDRLLSVISTWMGNIIIMLDSGDTEQRFLNYFMNGPYFFEVQKKEEGRLTLRFVKQIGESKEREELPSITLALTDYYDALLHLAANVIRDPGFQRLENEQTRSNFERSVAKLRASL